MIFYLACKHRSLGVQLNYFPGELAGAVCLLQYEHLYSRDVLPGGTYIFTDFDRLPPAQLAKLHKLWDWFDTIDADIRRFNDPRRALFRFDLLRRLHEAGINDFNVYRLGDWREVRRFPVFIRKEKHQKEPVTGLLHDRFALAEAVAQLGSSGDHANIIVVEFCNEPFADGRYRKYGAFRVGDAHYVQHCYISKHWYIKSGTAELGVAEIAEAMEYRDSNPHAAQLREIFDIAGIEYGRIDYGVAGGRVQEYEINTNPTVISLSSVREPHPRIDSSKFARIHEEAMLPLARFTGTPLRLPEELVDRTGADLSIEEVHSRALAEAIKTGTERKGASGKLSKIMARLRA